MKKVSILILCAVALGAFEPGIMAVTPNVESANRLQREYNQFKGAAKCLKQKGWKGCSSVERKRIVVAGVALTVLIVAVVGGGSLLGWKMGTNWLLKKQEEQEVYQNILAIINERGSTDEVNQAFQAAKKFDVNTQDKDKLRLLHHAVFSGRPEIVQAVIDAGAVVDARGGRWDRTALFMAITEVEKPEIVNKIVNILLDAGADMNAKHILTGKIKGEEVGTPKSYATERFGLKKLLEDWQTKNPRRMSFFG